jgi:superfamily I DNA/RNA helicase
MAPKFRFSDLNPQQQDAVKQIEGAVLILAGAGTGKTRVITARIAWMIEQDVPPENILAVTFTNKAANEMRERVAGMVEKKAAKAVTLSTFHALCLRILRRDITALEYKSNFTIYDQSDQIGLLKKIITRTAAKDEKLEPGLANSLISRAKNQSLGRATIEHPLFQKNALLKDVFIRYENELKRFNAVDFDDLLLLTVKILREFPEKRAYWQDRFQYLMVDEFQDTNHPQLELVAQLAGEKQNVCVVGDDDQSIYGWRGAEVSNILEFERHFPNPTVVKLEQNYRSTNAILNTANALIKNNPRRRPKQLWSALGDGEKIRLMPIENDAEEAEFIANEIHKRHLSDAIRYDDFAIIFRMNAQSRLLETNLRHLKIPYRIIGGKSFFDKREIKDFLAYMRVLVNTSDDISLLRIINTPPRGISALTADKALQYSIQQKCGVYEALGKQEFQEEQLTPRAREAVNKFVALVDDFETKLFALGADFAEVMTELVESTGYLEDLRRSCKTPEEADERERSIREFLETMREWQKQNQGTPKEFLDEMSLDDDWQKDKKDKDDTGVWLITMHAAKGLEFPHVYIIGLEDGILPHSRSKEEGTTDEERRLFYVGITRAQQSLAISYCNTRRKYGQEMPCHPSAFLKELPEEYVETLDVNALLDAPAEEKHAQSAFARMRALMED